MLNVFMTGNKFPKMFIYDFVSMVSVKTAVVVSNFPATVRQFNSVPPNNIDQGFFVHTNSIELHSTLLESRKFGGTFGGTLKNLRLGTPN